MGLHQVVLSMLNNKEEDMLKEIKEFAIKGNVSIDLQIYSSITFHCKFLNSFNISSSLLLSMDNTT